ncbi:unnamed protein product [Caenorhabditis sp. 36 PRJEB53466]|nr:unnamed protein product [Caenorhabditis sp. 36 PRJEB53466]
MNVNPIFADELRSSGITLAARYLGSIPVMVSISDMVSEMRIQVVTECIKHVAASVGLSQETEINPVVSRVIGEVQQDNYPVDLNISSKMLRIIRKNRLVQRNPFAFFSFGAQGQKGTDTESMFGYIAKKPDGTDRRCHVISCRDVQKFMDIITDAITVNTFDARAAAQAEGKSTDGFTEPAPSGLDPNRQSFVSNVRPSTVMDDVKNQVWYHGKLSRDDAHALLTSPGDFLVRKSDHTPGQFVLSGITVDNEHKHLILLDSKQRVRTRDREFNNISELIEYHMTNGMAVRSEGRDRETSLNLIRPIPAPRSQLPK